MNLRLWAAGYFQPFVQNVLDHLKTVAPFSHLRFQWLDEWRAEHGQCFDDVVIEQKLYLVDWWKDFHALHWQRRSGCRHFELPKLQLMSTHCFTVRNELEDHVFPVFLHLGQRLLQWVFFACGSTYLLQPWKSNAIAKRIRLSLEKNVHSEKRWMQAGLNTSNSIVSDDWCKNVWKRSNRRLENISLRWTVFASRARELIVK